MGLLHSALLGLLVQVVLLPAAVFNATGLLWYMASWGNILLCVP